MSEPLDTTFSIPKSPLLPTAFRYSVIISGIGILFTMILFLMDMDTSQVAQYLGFLVLIGGLVMGALEYRDKVNQGFMTHGQVIGLGVLTSVIASLIMGVFSVIYMEYINPEMMEQIILQQEEVFIERGMSDEQIEEAVGYMRKFSDPMFSIPMSVIWYAVMGLIISAIAGFFIKKD